MISLIFQIDGGETITISSYNSSIKYMVYVIVFKNSDPNLPMSTSEAKVFFRSPGMYTKEVEVPSDPTLKQGYWLVGCFDGLNGISNFNVKNVLLFNNPNGQPNLCD